MSDKPSLRIDWFDGTIVENAPSNTNIVRPEFADEDQPETSKTSRTPNTEKKPIGYKRLQDISMLQPPTLILEVSHRPGFWNLLEIEDLKGDFIVLIVKILASVYHSIEPDHKSKIESLLQTQFKNSKFFVVLQKYLKDLPYVKIVEKKMNLQLWNDVEYFYTNLLNVYEGILNLGNNSKNFLNELQELIEITESSAIGVWNEHTETFNEHFFTRIIELKNKVTELINNDKEDSTKHSKSQDMNSFKNLNILPNRNDLLCEPTFDIQPNIVNGAYQSVEHYLDLQFKLLREDCFAPIREGICKYMENPSKRRHENIRIYPKVRVIRTCVSNNKVGYLVDVARDERLNQGLIDSKRYAYNKQLMFGSLLLLTSDNFNTILCATVLDSSMDLLSNGFVAVEFHNPVSKTIFSDAYLMVESEVFFEPYHRVLKVLQNHRLDDMPMRRYIVDVQIETQPPAYLTPETIYSITNPSNGEEIAFPVLDTNQWPTSQLGLDESQLEAYKLALTREFSVIQGPPGTGKTFIGIKIATTLLNNLSLEGTPMLIICYTNHALDQFLEGILNVTTNIIRLGSQSKSKVLEPYNLKNARMRVKCKYSYLYAKKRSELENIFKEMTDLQTEIERCEKDLISYKTLQPYLKIGDKLYELRNSQEDPVVDWLFNHLDMNAPSEDSNEKVEESIEDWETIDDTPIVDEINTCFSEQWALKEIDSMSNCIKYIKDVTEDSCESEKMSNKFEAQISKIRKRLNCFNKYRTIYQNESQNYQNIVIKRDLYELEPEKRWKLYYSAMRQIKNELMLKTNVLLENYNTASQELEEVATLIDGEVMGTARVVGATTSAAARRHHLVTRLHSPIVIVEEAAEILEAHIVASLTSRCQHLILIGDHKQLRPATASYKLARHYKLDISLFERMVRAGTHMRALRTQRRMRTDMAALLAPALGAALLSHPTVLSYGHVRGLACNLYFYSHSTPEDYEELEDSWSHRNVFEARWCVALANYLLQMEYRPDEVTILSTYTGQVSLIRELSKQCSSLRDVKITAVDNYQGQENRIVLLSLVRSNRDGNIGFLAAPNRICVALSRAKEGFYIFGNMNLLKSASEVWRQIYDLLVVQSAIGDKLTLRCRIHENNLYDIVNSDDFRICLSGPCLRICEKK